MHLVDQDVVVMYTLYLITAALILLICNSAPQINFFKSLVNMLKNNLGIPSNR